MYYWNIIDYDTNAYMLGGSVETVEEGEKWLAKYKESYPRKNFGLVEVLFKYPPWWSSADAESVLKFLNKRGRTSTYLRVRRPDKP